MSSSVVGDSINEEAIIPLGSVDFVSAMADSLGHSHLWQHLSSFLDPDRRCLLNNSL